MFTSLRNSWHFAKLSYAFLWQHKHLLVFPFFSGIATIAVLAGFFYPLFDTGLVLHWMANLDDGVWNANDIPPLAVTFLYYFVNYFIIVFFNTALVATVMNALDHDDASIGGGLSVAYKRLPQIAGWALMSAVIGVLLNMIERSHKQVGKIVVAVLGSAWTALTYFVVPVIALEGTGPITAVKRSTGVLRDMWGEAVTGQFSLGLMSMVVTIPAILLVTLVAWYLPVDVGPWVGIAAGLVIFGIIVISALATTAADTIFKGLLFSYATGKTLPETIEPEELTMAFGAR